MKLALIIVSLLFLLSLWYNFNQTTESEIEAQNLRKQAVFHKNAADSISGLYSDLMERDTVQAILYRNALDRAEKAENRYLKAEGDLRRERALNRKFTDLETDSLLSLVR